MTMVMEMKALEASLMLTDIQTLERASDVDIEELLKITERWATKDETRFNLYEPNPVMRPVHTSSALTRVIFGGNRSGKTHCEVIENAMSFLGRAPASIAATVPSKRLNPRMRQRFFTADYPNTFSKVIWPYITNLIKSDEIIDVIKDSGRIRAITNAKGGFIEFMTYEMEVTKSYGASRHRVSYDEQPPQEIRDENLARLIDENGEELFAMTPCEEANYGQTAPWIKDELYDKAGMVFEKDEVTGEVKEVSNPEGDAMTHVFFADVYDNKAINKDAADRILSKFSKEEREVRKTGHLLFLSGLVYKEWNDALHLCENFDDWWKGPLASNYTLYIAIDPHPRTPHNVLFLCARSDGLLVVVDELFAQADSSKHLVEMIQMKQRGKPAHIIIIDPLAYTRDPRDGSCLASDLITEGLWPVPIPASKDKARGIMKVREVLSGDDGKGRLLVTRGCKNFRYEVGHYVWDSYKKSTAATKGEKQKPVDKSDHAMENLYRLLLLNPEHVQMYIEKTIRTQGRNKTTGY